MKNNFNQFVRPDIAQMESYVPGTSAEDLTNTYKQSTKQLIKLNANENPYGMSPAARKALQGLFYNYYPRSDYPTLRQAIAKYTNMKTGNIILGSGSDEIIDLVLRAVIHEGDKVINCPPTFGMYEVATKLNRGLIVNIPRNKNFSLKVSDVLKNCKEEKIKIVFLCNPNSPTGNLTSQEEIIKILKTGKLVIVDEAYYEFSKTTVAPLLGMYKNLIVLRTLSKWAGLAGLRIGYAIMSEFLVEQILKIKPPFNVNSAAEKAALATLEDLSFSKKSIQKIISEKNRMYKELQTLSNIQVYWSYGNFIFLQTDKNNYQQLKDSFEENKIALRYYQSPLLANSIRITIGKPEQNNKVLIVFNMILNKKKYAFLDRDGTLIFEPQDTYQIDSIKKLKILDGVVKGLKELRKQDYQLVMVTNQDGLGTSSFPKANFQLPQSKMLEIFEKEGIRFNQILICPHLQSDKCGCRKPKTGLFKKFIDTNEIVKNTSFVFGDRKTDKEFAKNIKVRFILMKTNGNFYNELFKKGGIL